MSQAGLLGWGNDLPATAVDRQLSRALSRVHAKLMQVEGALPARSQNTSRADSESLKLTRLSLSDFLVRPGPICLAESFGHCRVTFVGVEGCFDTSLRPFRARDLRPSAGCPATNTKSGPRPHTFPVCERPGWRRRLPPIFSVVWSKRELP